MSVDVMEPDDDGPAYSTKITLRIYDTDIPPDEITTLLAITPDGAYGRGDEQRTRNGRVLKIHASTFWHAQLLSACYPPNRLWNDIDGLVTRLETQAELFARIKASGGRSEFFIGWFLRRSSGLHLSSDLMSRLASLGIDLDFDVYLDLDQDQ